MRYLRLIFIALLMASALLAVIRGSWESHLVCLNQTFIVDLPQRPIWSPPAIPTYDTFRQTFTELPLEKPAGAVLVRVFRYDDLFFVFIFYVAASSGICGLVYLFARRGAPDIILHYALFIAIGYIVAAVACFTLWLIFGGWGPPGVLLFSVLGIGFGILLAKRFWRSHAA